MPESSNEIPELLSKLIASVEMPEGRARLKAVLDRRPYPHFEAHPESPGVLVKIDQDGTRTAGRFVKRKFVPIDQGT